jgi:beta-lactamase class A
MSDLATDGAHAESLSDHIAALFEPLGARTAVAARRLSRMPGAGGPSKAGKKAGAPRHAEGQPIQGQPIHRTAGAVLLRADLPLPMGELARLAVAVELLRRVDLGQFRLEEPLSELHGSSFAHASMAGSLGLGEVCARVLAAEEPAATRATDALLELVGLGETNETLSRLKLEATHLARECDGERVAHRVSVTTAGNLLTLLGLLSGSAIPGAEWLRAALASQARLPALRAALPAAAALAHLPALLGGIRHDVGWLRGPGGGCVFAVLIAGAEDRDAATHALASVLRLCWNAWCAG